MQLDLRHLFRDCEKPFVHGHANDAERRPNPSKSWLPSLGSTARACDRGGASTKSEEKEELQLLTSIERRNYSRGAKRTGDIHRPASKVTESRFRCCCVALRLRQLPSQVGSSRFQAHFTPLNPRSSRGYTSFSFFYSIAFALPWFYRA